MEWVFYFQNCKVRTEFFALNKTLFLWIDTQCSSHQQTEHGQTEENCD